MTYVNRSSLEDILVESLMSIFSGQDIISKQCMLKVLTHCAFCEVIMYIWYIFEPIFDTCTSIKHTHVHTHCTHGTYGVLHCLLFCDQTRPNLRISLVGYHCAIEFPCGVLLFYCCKYPTTYGVRVHLLSQGCDWTKVTILTKNG